MIQGLYLSAQGAQIQQLRQEVISNNLANASTASFKRDLIRAQANASFDSAHGGASRLPHHQNELPGGITPYDVATEFVQGQLSATGNPMDVGIVGKGFLQAQDGRRTYLTRDARLAIAPDGTLVSRDHGHAILGANGSGPILGLDPSLPLTVESDGLLRQSGGEVGRLAILEPFNYRQIQKSGHNQYVASGRVVNAPEETQLKQGMTELSSVQPVTELTSLIEASRAFESNINMIKHQDEALGRLLSVVPRH